MSRKIIFDVETTGLYPEEGDKIVEIGCVELLEDNKLGREWSSYVNPEREIGEEAVRVHGITNQAVALAPTFAQIAEDFLTFVGEAPLVAHNADFDRGFINSELASLGKKKLSKKRFIDTLFLARQKFSSGKMDLDSLCDRFRIEKNRAKHGALLDAKLLALVYLKLLPWKEQLALRSSYTNFKLAAKGERQNARILPSAAEKLQHSLFIKQLKRPLWTS